MPELNPYYISSAFPRVHIETTASNLCDKWSRISWMEAAYWSPNSDSETQWHTGVTLASVLPKNLPERGAGPLGGGEGVLSWKLWWEGRCLCFHEFLR